MLVDFGIARIVRPTEKGVTAIGTMGYAPPELFAGKVEPRSDIYSLGATMFHMLTGSDPQDNPLLIFDFTKNPKPAQIVPTITPGMEQILMRAVAHKPEDRQASALDLMRALEDHSAKLRGGSRPDSRGSSSRSSGGYIPPPSNSPTPPSAAVAIPLAGTPPPAVAQAAVPASPEAVQLDWVFCGHCGQKIAVDDVFCPHCGSRQPIAGAHAAAEVLAGGRVTAQLLVVSTRDMVKPFRIDKDTILIGRTDPHTGIFPEVDLTMHDPETKVSRRHARIYRQGEQFFIEDLASVNGTTIVSASGGSVRLNPKTPRVLAGGDELRMGETILKFEIV